MAEGGSGNDVNVKFGASIDDLKSKLGEVSGIFDKLLEHWKGFAAAAAGGAAFAEIISDTIKINSAALGLSKTLGITAAEAGTLNTALGDIGSDSETYTGAFLKFNRALRSNSEELKALGVDVDGFRSGQKSSNEVFQEAIRIVGQYKPGIDQTQVAMQLFGRNVADVQKLLKLNNDVLEEARKKNEELNLTITQEGLDAVKKYKLALNDVHDVYDGIVKTIGEAVIPIFTESANQLASFGPTVVEGTKYAVGVFVEVWRSARDLVFEVFGAIVEIATTVRDSLHDLFGGETLTGMQIFKNALAVLQIVFVGFRVAVQEAVNVVKTGIELMSSAFSYFATVADKALHLDFAGAKAAFQAGVDERNRILAEGVARAIAIATKGAEDIDRAANRPLAEQPKGTPADRAPAGGTKTAPLIDKTAQAQAAALAAAMLQLQKAQQEASLQLWTEGAKEAEAILDDGYRQNLVSTETYYSSKLAIERAGIDLSLAVKQKELDAAKAAEKAIPAGTAHEAERVKMQAQEAKLIGEITVLTAQRGDVERRNAAEYRIAQQQRIDTLMQIAAGAQKATVDNQVGRERSDLEAMRQLRQVSADQAFEIQRQLEARSYSAAVDALAAKQELVHGDVVKQAEVNAERLNLEQQHQNRLLEIDRAASIESSKYSIEAQQSVQASFATMVDGLLSGVDKISDVWRKFEVSLANAFTNLIAQKFTERLFDVTGVNKLVDGFVSVVTGGIDTIVQKFIGGEVVKTTAETAGVAKRKVLAAGELATGKTMAAIDVETTTGAEAAKTGATVAGATVRTTAEVASTETSVAVTGESAIFTIGAKAWEAASSVYAAIAAIPYVGPFLAPVMAAAAAATILGFASRIFSSAGGEMQVGQDRLNLVHKDETILPATFATGLRRIVGDGGINPLIQAADMITGAFAQGSGGGAAYGPGSAGGTQWALPTAAFSSVAQTTSAARPSAGAIDAARQAVGGGTGDVHLHVSAIDGQSVQRFFVEHKRPLASVLRQMGRDAMPVKG